MDKCKIKDCKRESWQKELCMMHYQRLRRYGSYEVPEKPKFERHCDVKDCNGYHVALGLCEKHYARLKRTGSVEITKNMNPPEICTIKGCNRKYSGRGYCLFHYNKWLRNRMRDEMIAEIGVFIDPNRLSLIKLLGSKCANCGFCQIGTLQLDHKNSGGCKERKKFRHNQRLVNYYIKNPEEAIKNLQVLCANCNMLKSLCDNERHRNMSS